ncbi:putative lipid II flippase FtsW [Alicyclobacillaceae bacterium I2511]|nr:putative lipid II flippase FtsW [Alicyclobacillaceae bacterium I2511]
MQKQQMDYILFFTTLILCAVGVLTVYSASTVWAIQSQPPLPAAYFANRQLISAILGVGLMIGVSQLPHRVWYRFAPLMMMVSLGLLLLVLMPHVGWSQNGGRRWIGHGSLHLQPSEIAILVIVIYLAFFFTKQAMLLHDLKRGLFPPLLIIGLNFLFIFAEPDMGTAMILLGAALSVVFTSGVRIKPLILTLISLTPVLIILAMLESYRSNRIIAWLHPFAHMKSLSYQLVQGMTAISAGGWFGRGFGQSIEKAGYLPYPQNDFIFPVFVEEWGLIGAVTLLAIFSVLIWRGFHVARHAPDRFSALLSIGLTTMMAINAFINLCSVTGLLPVTGVPLPFISYGGTALIMNMISVGILLSISRRGLVEEPEEDELAEVIEATEVQQRRQAQRRNNVRGLPGLGEEFPSRQAQVRPFRSHKTQQNTNLGWRGQRNLSTGLESRENRFSNSKSGSRKPLHMSSSSNPGKAEVQNRIPEMTWRERNAHWQELTPSTRTVQKKPSQKRHKKSGKSSRPPDFRT